MVCFPIQFALLEERLKIDVFREVDVVHAYRAQEKTVSPGTSRQIVDPDSGFDALSRVTVEPVAAYDGVYQVTPSEQLQVLPTADRFLTGDVNVNPIPYAEVSNNSGGKTIIIGG